jgi:hypothetical protein
MTITEDDLDTMVETSFKIEAGKDCATCGHKFTPIDDQDKFCKSCLRNLYFELIRDTENIFDRLQDAWVLKELKNSVKLHREICGDRGRGF